LKELLLVGTAIIALTSSTVTAGTTQGSQSVRPERGNHVSVATLNRLELEAQDVIDKAKMEKLRENRIKVDKTIDKLSKYVGKTWYVFSGNTPSGWDCSGLTMWFYEQLGIELIHRASVQDDAGTKTNTPKPGDLVVFKYNGYKQAYHVGIYIGDGKMIHAPKHGHVTRIEDIATFGGDYSKISYRSLIETS
jgi:cell wall-associated NlpC family hydrolase